jgi:hypothetical protein
MNAVRNPLSEIIKNQQSCMQMLAAINFTAWVGWDGKKVVTMREAEAVTSGTYLNVLAEIKMPSVYTRKTIAYYANHYKEVGLIYVNLEVAKQVYNQTKPKDAEARPLRSDHNHFILRPSALIAFMLSAPGSKADALRKSLGIAEKLESADKWDMLGLGHIPVVGFPRDRNKAKAVVAKPSIKAAALAIVQDVPPDNKAMVQGLMALRKAKQDSILGVQREIEQLDAVLKMCGVKP